MAAATSPATGQAYGVRRVCAIWGVARSSFYDARRQDARPPERPAGRPGPKPALSDAELLAAIRRDLARSPWTGEGHRKVWARLRVIDGIRVSRTRVLRIMGENSLLSPHRRPPRPANDHDGSITTEAPNVMWGADGAVIPTVEDGNVTLFIVAEHWNAEGLGWHVAKHGNRYAAAEALALAVSQVFGSVRADAARGVSLRHDHGSAFMSEYFQNQLKFFGMAPSFAFVRAARDQRRRRALHPYAEGADRLRPHLPGHRGGPRRRQGILRALQPALAVGKERLPKPRRDQAELDGRNDHNARGRITLPCVRKTGCGTTSTARKTPTAPPARPSTRRSGAS